MAPGRRETPRYVPCDCPVTLCRAPYRRPNLPCSAPPTTTRAAPEPYYTPVKKSPPPLCFLSSPADFAEIRADSPCKRRRAPPRAPRGVAVTRYTAGNSGPRSAVTPKVPAHRRPRGPGAPHQVPTDPTWVRYSVKRLRVRKIFFRQIHLYGDF